ncbi:zinc-dependent metalloprotease [Rubrobacter calidifluminis]|uniref:zinc-dependent metalloprotease n=1 Tax=Rubrobacter calidifluminis TaxID=1392640 RepID=UPI00235EFA61|nr:zinc-dependent metalloprotease [Rubrobacter calidifluminis]
MISWGAARTIAVAMAARTERRPVDDGFDYRLAARRALTPLCDFTGISLREPFEERRVLVSDRARWIDLNIENFGAVLEPILRQAAGSTGDLAWALGGVTLTAQVGVLLGFLSTRVLGQYDTGPLAARREDDEPGRVFFLDGNIASAAARLGVPPDGLRLWIVLHEMTHALQFEGAAWLGGYLGDLVQGMLGPLVERLGLRELLRRLADNLSSGGRPLELLMSRSQRAAFERVQAVMSLVEGYSDYVMHRVGREMVPHYEYISSAMARSREHRPPLESAIFRLTGLDLKMEQYRLGEQFAEVVASRVGMEGLGRVWERPENLPSLAEIHDPGLWLSRMESEREAG